MNLKSEGRSRNQTTRVWYHSNLFLVRLLCRKITIPSQVCVDGVLHARSLPEAEGSSVAKGYRVKGDGRAKPD